MVQICITISNKTKEFIDCLAEDKQCNISSAVRQCILTAKRVYENGTTEEKVKFIIGGRRA